jgi:hypothetical protein
MRTLTSLLLIIASVGFAQPPLTPQAAAVTAAIEKAFPGATIVTGADVDSSECGPAPTSPGFVQADFDGDGRADFAVLLNAGATGKVVDWQGKHLRETRYVLALFRAKQTGGFTVTRLNRFVQFWPVAAYIEPQGAGKLEGAGDAHRGAGVMLQNPGVSLVFCGKSAVVYYVSDHRVHEVWVGD